MLTDGQALVRLQELQREADANRNIYEQFLSRFNATSEQRLLQNSQTKVASPAIPPLRPTRPPLSLLLAALAAASLLMSTAVVAVIKSGSGKPRTEVSPAPSLSPGPMPPVWARIPDVQPRDGAANIWQKPVAPASEPHLGFHVRPLLDRIGTLPGPHGKVALVVSLQDGSGATTVARSLNRAVLNKGLLSVLIEVQPDFAAARPPQPAEQGLSMTTADLQSVNELLGASRKSTPLPADDIRSEFDLVIVHAPPVSAHPDTAVLATHADVVILVVRENAVDSVAIAAATAALSRFGPVPIGLVLNRVSTTASFTERRREARAMAG
jgi:hypothetical protein